MATSGANCKNARYNYLITDPSVGFASIATGTRPSEHGIVSDYWYRRLTNDWFKPAAVKSRQEAIEAIADTFVDKLRDLGVLRARDMPEVEVILVEEPEPEGPFGAKGVGEIGLVPTAGAVGGAVNRVIQVRLGVFNHNVSLARQYDVQLTALVITAARTIDVRQSNQDAFDAVIACIQGITQTKLNIVFQRLSQREIAGLYINLHIQLLCFSDYQGSRVKCFKI